MKTKIYTTIARCFLISIFSFLFFSKLIAQNLSSEYVTGEIIVQLNSDVTPSQLLQRFSQIELTQNQKISEVLNIWLFQYNSQIITPDSILNLLKQSNLVKTAQFNHYVYLNSTPNDPGFINQYGMNKIHAPEAWDISTGGTTTQNDQIVIAVLDGGFYITHQDIDFWKNTAEIPGNGIDDDGNGYIDDYDGWNAFNNNGTITSADHGTHVSGIAGAKGNNGIGVTGVNWNSKIMPIQAFSTSITEATVVIGYSYVLKMRQLYNQTNGAQGAFVVVTNASFSTHGGDVDDYPIWCGIYDALGTEGVLNVNAPWNLNEELGTDFNDIPGMCSSQYLIVVTNTDQNDELYDQGSGNVGSPWSKTYIDLTAPGTDIYSTLPGNSYGNMTGTSMAAPHVAGAIALMYAAACDQLITNYKANPSQVALTIKQFLLNGSDPIYNLLLKIGYGRLNVYKSIIKMSEQYDYDLYVTGTETSSKQYDAIHDITVENYSGTGNINVTFRAGNSIVFEPGTTIEPGSNGYFHAFIDENAFDCAIPYQPLSVDLIAPEQTYCGGYVPITCNAVPTGGKLPYSYIWFTKGISASNWTTINYNYPDITLVSSEDFYVQVQVTDDRGYTALSPIKFIDCIETAKIIQTDSTINHADTIISLNDKNNSGDITTSTFLESNLLRQTFNAFPNPSTGEVTITFSLEKSSSVTIQITDNTGKKIIDVVKDQFYDIGKHSIKFNDKELSNGMYFYIINTNEGVSALKLVITK